MTFVYTLGDVVGLSLLVLLLIGGGIFMLINWIKGRLK